MTYSAEFMLIRHALMPNMTLPLSYTSLKEISPILPISFVGMALLRSLLLTPLEVIATRLSVQLNFTALEPRPVAGAEQEADLKAAGELYNPDEDVIRQVLSHRKSPFIHIREV